METQEFVPMSVSQILDRTFRLYRNNFVRFLTIVALVQVPVALVQIVIAVIQQNLIPPGAAPTAVFSPTMIFFNLVAVGIAMVAHALSSAAMTRSISESYLGRDVTPKQAYSFVLPRLTTVLGASILVALLVGVGFVCCIVPGIFVQLFLALTIPIVIIEQLGVTSSMKRSKDLMTGNLGKGFGLFLLVFLITVVPVYGLLGIGSLIAHMAGVTQGAMGVVIIHLFTLAGALLAAPVSSAAAILLYYDLRIRKEGFDLEQLTQRLGGGQAGGV